MEIRKCTEAETAAAGAFYDSVVAWLDRHINYPKWVYKVYPSEESVRAMTALGTQYICLENGEIAGAFVLNTDPEGAYENGHWKKELPAGSYMVLHAVAVRPDLQGNGRGDEIVRYCIALAKSEGFRGFRLDIVPTNTPARKLYEKHGFTFAGEADLERGIAAIPVFSLFEMYW